MCNVCNVCNVYNVYNVCVCEREREREREGNKGTELELGGVYVSLVSLIVLYIMVLRGCWL